MTNAPALLLLPMSFLFSSCFISLSQCRLRIITLTPGKVLPSLGGYSITSAYSVAVDDMTQRYPQLFANAAPLTTIDLPDVCTGNSFTRGLGLDTFMEIYTAEKKRADVTTVVFSSEENILALTCASAVGDLKRLSTTASIQRGTSPAEYGMPVLGLLKAFNWTRLAMIFDLASPGFDNSGRISGGKSYITSYLQNVASRVDLLVTTINSTVGSPQQKALLDSANHSRIILIAALHIPLRNLLAAAFDNLLTTEQYVIILYYTLQIPGDMPPKWNENEEIDAKVRDTFKRSLLIRIPSVNWEKAMPIVRRIAKKGTEIYNISFDEENMFNEYAIGCYETIDLLSQVLNESKGAMISGQINPSGFLKRMKGRTFQFDSENVTFSNEGKRPLEFVLQSFDLATSSFRSVSRFNYTSGKWFEDASWTQIWPPGKVPVDRPICGMKNELCPTSSFVESSGGIATIVILTGVVCLTASFILLNRWIAKRYSDGNITEIKTWWKLDGEKLKLHDLTKTICPCRVTDLSSLNVYSDIAYG